MAGLHRKSEGKTKYLVLRRDGTVPEWDWFVLGARDPAAPMALRVYAQWAQKFGYDQQYVDDVNRLANEFAEHCDATGAGDPDAPLHRIDNRWVAGMLAGTMRVPHDVVSIDLVKLRDLGKKLGINSADMAEWVKDRFAETVQNINNLLPDDMVICDNSYTTVGSGFIEEPLEPGQVRINADVWSWDASTGWVNQCGEAWMASGMWPNEVPGAIVAPKEKE